MVYLGTPTIIVNATGSVNSTISVSNIPYFPSGSFFEGEQSGKKWIFNSVGGFINLLSPTYWYNGVVPNGISNIGDYVSGGQHYYSVASPIINLQGNASTTNLLVSSLSGSGSRCLHTDGLGNLSALTADCVTTSGVTSITAGAGLSGGTITTSGTIALDLTGANAWTGQQTFNTSAPVFGTITGSTQCLQVNSSGLVSGTGLPCGSGGGSSTGGSWGTTTSTESGELINYSNNSTDIVCYWWGIHYFRENVF